MGAKCDERQISSEGTNLGVSSNKCFDVIETKTVVLRGDCTNRTTITRSLVANGSCGGKGALVVSNPTGGVTATNAPSTSVTKITTVPLIVAVSVTTIGGTPITNLVIPGVPTGNFAVVDDVKVFNDNQSKTFKEGPLKLLVPKVRVIATKNGGKTYVLCSDAKPIAGACSNKANTYEFSSDSLIVEGTATWNTFFAPAKVAANGTTSSNKVKVCILWATGANGQAVCTSYVYRTETIQNSSGK